MESKQINLQDVLNIVPTQSMSDRIFQELSRLILDGTLKEGYTFPNEAVLCEQLHVGRTSLREAYKALELSGFVTRTKRGTVVNGKSQIVSSTPLKVAMEQSSEKDFLEFRCMLEAEAARLAAERATDKDIQELRHLLSEISNAGQRRNYEAMMKLDRKFHKALAISSKNKLIVDTMTAMTEVWDRETRTNFWCAAEKRPEILTQMHSQHQAVVSAIENGDADRARNEILNHIQYVSHR